MNISKSLDYILNSKEILGHTFYEVFLEDYPEVQKYFEGVNIVRQGVLLTMALIVVEQYYRHPYEATKKYLQYLGTKHHDLNIPKELYPKWQAAMIKTLARIHGDQWDETLSAEWSEAFDRATALMFDGYETHFTV